MRLLLLLPFMPVCLALVALGDPMHDAIPTARGKARYEGLRTKSPFALASAPVATPAPQASFAANWFVSGIGRIGGADFVTVKSRDLATQFSLFAQESDPKTGVMLASVNWSESVGKSTVILRKGNETARLEFNEAEVKAAAAPAAAPRQVFTPNGNGGTLSSPRPAGAPPPPARRVTPVVPPR